MPSFMKDLNITSRISGAYRAAKLEPIGISGPQYSFLLRICREPGITQEELSRALCIHKSNVGRQVEKLEQNGFLERRTDSADKRLLRLFPTEKAKEALPLVRKTVRTWNAYLTADFSSEELAVLLSLMERVRTRAVRYFETGTLGMAEGETGGAQHEETV